MEQTLNNLLICAVIIFTAIQIMAHRYTIKDFFLRIRFGKDRHNFRKSIRFTEKTEPYFKRKRLIENFLSEYELSQKEILWCLKLIGDVDRFEDLHLNLFKMLKEKGFFEKTVYPVFNIFKDVETREFRKLQNIAWH